MSEKKTTRYHLPFPLYDTHFHALHMLERDAENREVLGEAFQTNLIGAVEVAVDELHFVKRLELAGSFPGLLLSAGIHPSASGSETTIWNERFAMIRWQAASPLVAAIGETGLDYFRDYAPRETQERAFRDHLELAAETNLPVIIHNRSADESIIRLVRESSCRKGVFHCFSSDLDTAKKALDMGFHVSFAGNLTYKKTEMIREAAAEIPSDRILIETDSPYLSPQAVRGRSNHPGHLGYTLETLAEIRKEEPERLAERTVMNARKLFGSR